ncbi:MAG TPA: ABC transporter ATP-binding protein [Acidimicrobiia bacterium]|jgi:ATP-binding cassette subfamily B protein|nr:ABC transporter ATP-binding protein [Acidimicrobiia bacterium]
MMRPATHGFGRDASAVKGKRLERDLVRRVLRLARPYRRQLIGFVVTVVLAAVISALPPLILRAVIDTAIPEKDRALVGLLAAGAVFLALLNAGLTLIQRYYSARIGEGLIFDMRTALFDHVQHQPLSFFTRTQTGSLMSRMNNDVIGAQQAVTNTLGTVFSNIVSVVVTVAFMLALEWRLTLLTLAILPFFIIPAKRMGPKLQRLTRESMQLNASMNNTIAERFNVGGALVVKLFGKHRRESDTFTDRAGRVRDIGVQTAMYSRVLVAALGLVAAIGTAIVYFVGGNLAISGTIGVGTIAAFAVYVSQIYQPLTQLASARVDVLTALVSFERVFEVLDFPPLITNRPGAVDLLEPVGRVEFDHVWFRHPSAAVSSIPSLEEASPATDTDDESAWILRDVSFTVAPGELVALVGPSGAGKTTSALLVPRIYDVSAGEVRVDGRDVRDYTLESLRESVGMVMQDPHLFHDTIRANLRYARPDATDAELVEACTAARIHDLIASLPDGYDTLVGDRGYRMSGGEKQRLAIARMLLKDPAVVILDEATSHLDSESELAIQHALADALVGRTSLVIAHRLSTIVAADRILVLEHGRIIESGRHEDLLRAGGVYTDLYRTQVDQPAADAG